MKIKGERKEQPVVWRIYNNHNETSHSVKKYYVKSVLFAFNSGGAKIKYKSFVFIRKSFPLSAKSL